MDRPTATRAPWRVLLDDTRLLTLEVFMTLVSPFGVKVHVLSLAAFSNEASDRLTLDNLFLWLNGLHHNSRRSLCGFGAFNFNHDAARPPHCERLLTFRVLATYGDVATPATMLVGLDALAFYGTRPLLTKAP